jgi:hypothetical protein
MIASKSVNALVAFLGCLILLGGRYVACHRDASPYGNAWTEDHHGYCTRSGWDALTGGPGSFALACLLLALTALWPATALLVLRGRVVFGAIAAGSVAVVVFYVAWGHVAIVGGAGG